jgi:tetratricopeptide (TPR) repeat protein
LLPLINSGKAKINAKLAYAEAGASLGNRDDAIVLLEKSLTQSDLTQRERQQIHSVLGKLYDKSGAFDKAFENYRKSNALKQGLFDLQNHIRFIDKLISVHSKEFMASASRADTSTDLPVFIVGMPRSGTSLVEQILASHPAVFGAGELDDIRQISVALPSLLGVSSPYPECLERNNPHSLNKMVDRYVDRLREFSNNAAHITDKMPLNYLYLGLIDLLFPSARVIHIVRNPLDTCLSCYFQEFTTTNSYAYDLESLGAYYKQYERIMEHWKNVLKIRMLEVKYEELVDDQENISRQIIDFCGLDWDDRVLRFYETKRSVATPSFDQVRQPMYRNSIERWKNYERHLGPLIATIRDPRFS